MKGAAVDKPSQKPEFPDEKTSTLAIGISVASGME
jgi:hypothetical protein